MAENRPQRRWGKDTEQALSVADGIIYFDNAATTRPREEALAEYDRAARELYANANSLHSPGFAAETRLAQCKAAVARMLGADAEVVFTSGGSAANSLAMLAAAQSTGHGARKKRIVSSLAEHSSVRGVCAYLGNSGHEVVYVPHGADGSLCLDALEAALDGSPALVSLMHVNNETGVMADLQAVSGVIKAAGPQSLLHVDAVAGFGKHGVDMNLPDILTFASHKVGGPKGVGGLCFGKRLLPLISAETNSGGIVGVLRQGTADVPAISAFVTAAEIAFAGLDAAAEHAAGVKEYIAAHARSMGAELNGGGKVSPYILNMSFAGVRSETLINHLSGKGVCVSAGSSCSARKKDRNILTHYGLPGERAESSVRLSFSAANTLDEAARFVDILGEALPMLRKFSTR
ncbi:MAG: aminotransferase class V-fold PLP-dependent enzyme [Defluviitaleaceae bacterium]|nr:aminotransferase class V-fold PLP-dependent enzyme [Defluviitaleaceae bacterium]